MYKALPEGADLNQGFVIHEAPATNSGSAKERLVSLDAFRGLVIVTMLLVDNAKGIANGAFAHEGWDGIKCAG